MDSSTPIITGGKADAAHNYLLIGGIRIKLKEIYFRVLFAGETGVVFISNIDVSAFIKGIAEQAESYAPHKD